MGPNGCPRVAKINLNIPMDIRWPANCKANFILGIDEAGRGPVLGRKQLGVT